MVLGLPARGDDNRHAPPPERQNRCQDLGGHGPDNPARRNELRFLVDVSCPGNLVKGREKDEQNQRYSRLQKERRTGEKA